MSLRTMNAVGLDEDFMLVARQLCEMAKTGCARWVFLGECARWAVFVRCGRIFCFAFFRHRHSGKLGQFPAANFH